jgi:hypothetical protein
MYHTKKVRREYERQESLRKGWQILRDVAATMSASKLKKQIELLDNYEGDLKTKLGEYGIKSHKAIHIFRQYASEMRKKKYFDYGITNLWLAGDKRA